MGVKNKLNNPKEELTKELKVQEKKKDRIKEAYINEVFTIEEYKKESAIIDENIKNLERQLLEQNQVDDLNFTEGDILIKRDIDFINKIKLPNLYNQIEITWKDLSREEKAQIITNYIDDITLRLDVDGDYIVNDVNFRSTFYNDFKSLYDKGFIDWKFIKMDVDGIGYVRVSQYLPQKQVERHVMRLREYYDVHYYEGILDFETKMFDTQKREEDEIVRIFPLEPIDGKKTKINMGMLGVSKDSEIRVENEEDLFHTIPPEDIEYNEYILMECDNNEKVN